MSGTVDRADATGAPEAVACILLVTLGDLGGEGVR